MVASGKAERQLPPQRVSEQDQRRKREAPYDRDRGRNDAELKRDREPSRAPDQSGKRIEIERAHVDDLGLRKQKPRRGLDGASTKGNWLLLTCAHSSSPGRYPGNSDSM